MPIYLDELAPRDLKKTTTIRVTTTKVEPDGTEREVGFDIPVTYYPNRITGQARTIADDHPLLAGEEDDSGRDLMRQAIFFCDIVQSIDIAGEVRDLDGALIEGTSATTLIPVEPRIIRHLPTWTRLGILRGIGEAENPNPNGSRRSRRRS